MKSDISPSLQFFLELAKAKTVMSRRFDNRLSFNGLGLNEFIILWHISQSPGEKLRRVDLAEKIGITASGITRMLLPMEKIGLVNREASEQDARVSYVSLAPGGKRLLRESLETAEVLATDLLQATKAKKIEELTKILTELGKITVY